MLPSILLIPVLGIFLISMFDSYFIGTKASVSQLTLYYKNIALVTSIVNLVVSLIIFILLILFLLFLFYALYIKLIYLY